MRFRFTIHAAILALTSFYSSAAAEPAIHVDSAMPPPGWALMERALLDANSRAVEEFAGQYLDERGYLLHTIRWGTLDGPDDAIETFYNWTLLHALGGSDAVLEAFKKGQEGHIRQYGELRTELTELAKNGAYHKEFITQFGLVPHRRGNAGVFPLGTLRAHQPAAGAAHEALRRHVHGRGSRGAQLRPRQEDHQKHLERQPGADVAKGHGLRLGGRSRAWQLPTCCTIRRETRRMLDLIEWYPRMLAHCEEYLDSVGDNFLNMGATLLGLNAYALTHEKKYRDWTLDYMNAWKERTAKTGGMIPSNIGLDGTLGGEHDGQWWKGTYGWNFTIFDGELQQIAHRNYFTAASWAGFSNALLLTGDQSYVDVLRKQLDLIYEHKKVEDGKTLLPQMYGDPRGYKYNGEPEFYQYTGNLFSDRLTEIYLWSMDREDLERVPAEKGWIGFLEGNDPDYPTRAMAADFEHIRERVERIRNDPTSPDTRLADFLLRVVPATTETLTRLTLRRLFRRRPYLGAEQPAALFRSGEAAFGAAPGCRGARRKTHGRLRHGDLGQRQPN